MSTISPQGVAKDLSENGLIIVTWVGVALGVVFTGVRIGIRLQRMKRLLVDDYFIMAALGFLIINAALQTVQAPHLYHMVLKTGGANTLYHVTMYIRYEFVIIGMFWSVLWCIKGSFLALFWIISDGLPQYRRAWWAISVFTVMTYIGCWLGSALNCHPPSNYFKPGKCTKPIDKQASLISICYSTAVDIVTDLLIMSFPLRILWKTKMNIRQKLGLAMVFCLAFIIIAASIVRAISISGRSYSDQVALAIWSIAESSISMIVGCLPPFKTFVSGSNSSAKYNYNYNSSGVAGNNYDRTASSARIKRRSATTGSWSELPIPLQERAYQNLESNSQRKNDVYVAGGRVPSPDNSRLSSSEDGSGHGEIRMVKEFSVVTST